MALRLVEIVLPAREADTLQEILDIEPRGGPWRQGADRGLTCTRFVLDAENAGDIVDEVQRRYCHVTGFHLLIQPVSVALPRPPEPEDEDQGARTYGSKRGGLTREELTTEARDLARSSKVFYATVVLSTIVVAIGLLRGNAAVIIGAMVIAPLLGPNVALALATTLGEGKLMRQGLRSNASGIVIALLISIVLGALYTPDALNDEIAARTGVHYSDILLALAAGSAGALALTTGVASALVGVMVAVALLPPTAVLGIMLGTGRTEEAAGAALLLGVNVICVNLAATATFLVQGIRPRTWWKADQARRATRIALMIGVVLVLALAALIWVMQTGTRSPSG